MIETIFGLMLLLCLFALLVLVCVLIGITLYDEIQDIKHRKKGEKK